MNVYGYVKGNGKITATGSTQVTENMFITGFSGGSVSGARFLGTDKIFATTFMYGSSDYTVSSPNMFPFNQYELRAIQSKLELQYGTNLRGMIKIATSEQGESFLTIKAKVHLVYMNIISSNASTASSGIIRMTASGSKANKSFVNGRVKINTEGTIVDGYTTLKVPVMAKSVVMDSQKVIFPIDGRTDITIDSGTFTQSYMFKLLPGATLTIKSGATYNMSNTMVTYKEGFTDSYPYTYPTGRGDSRVTVEGTFNVNGKFGGDIYGVSGGKVVIGSSATITSVKSLEGGGTMARSGLNINFTFTEAQSQTRNLTLNNASGTTAASTGTTYTYNGSAWA